MLSHSNRSRLRSRPSNQKGSWALAALLLVALAGLSLDTHPRQASAAQGAPAQSEPAAAEVASLTR